MASMKKMTRKIGRCATVFAVALLLLCVAGLGPSHAQTTSGSSSTSSSASQQSGFTDCPGALGKVVQSRLEQSIQFGTANAFNQGNEVYNQATVNQGQNPQGPGFRVKDTYCLQDVLLHFNLINGLLSAATQFIQQIANMIVSFANSVCQVAKNAIMTAVNNALDSVCIPLPSLSFSMSLPDMKRKSCSGYAPLRDMMKVDIIPGLDYSSLVPQDLLTAPLSRWIQKNNIGSFNYSIRNGRY